MGSGILSESPEFRKFWDTEQEIIIVGSGKKIRDNLIIVESGIISGFREFWDTEQAVIIVESRIISELFPEFWEFTDINGIRK